MKRNILLLLGIILLGFSNILRPTNNVKALEVLPTHNFRKNDANCNPQSNEYLINNIVFSPNNRLILADISDKVLKVWDIQTKTELYTLSDETFNYHSINFGFSPDNTYIVTSGAY